MTGTLERTTFSPKKIRDQKGVEKKDNYHNCVNKTLSCYKAICVNVSRSSGDYFSPEDRTAVITIFAKKRHLNFNIHVVRTRARTPVCQNHSYRRINYRPRV